MSKFGECKCGGNLQPVYFTEEERKKGIKTGRKRRAVSHLVCENCLRNECIDDSFDGNWYKDQLVEIVY